MRVPALRNCQKLRSDAPFYEKCSTIDSDRYSLILPLITEVERPQACVSGSFFFISELIFVQVK